MERNDSRRFLFSGGLAQPLCAQKAKRPDGVKPSGLVAAVERTPHLDELRIDMLGLLGIRQLRANPFPRLHSSAVLLSYVASRWYADPEGRGAVGGEGRIGR